MEPSGSTTRMMIGNQRWRCWPSKLHASLLPPAHRPTRHGNFVACWSLDWSDVSICFPLPDEGPRHHRGIE